jgi:hypothetical protein
MERKREKRISKGEEEEGGDLVGETDDKRAERGRTK